MLHVMERLATLTNADEVQSYIHAEHASQPCRRPLAAIIYDIYDEHSNSGERVDHYMTHISAAIAEIRLESPSRELRHGEAQSEFIIGHPTPVSPCSPNNSCMMMSARGSACVIAPSEFR